MVYVHGIQHLEVLHTSYNHHFKLLNDINGAGTKKLYCCLKECQGLSHEFVCRRYAIEPWIIAHVDWISRTTIQRVLDFMTIAMLSVRSTKLKAIAVCFVGRSCTLIRQVNIPVIPVSLKRLITYKLISALSSYPLSHFTLDSFCAIERPILPSHTVYKFIETCGGPLTTNNQWYYIDPT
jgi:hypothetical protein